MCKSVGHKCRMLGRVHCGDVVYGLNDTEFRQRVSDNASNQGAFGHDHKQRQQGRTNICKCARNFFMRLSTVIVRINEKSKEIQF